MRPTALERRRSAEQHHHRTADQPACISATRESLASLGFSVTLPKPSDNKDIYGVQVLYFGNGVQGMFGQVYDVGSGLLAQPGRTFSREAIAVRSELVGLLQGACGQLSIRNL